MNPVYLLQTIAYDRCNGGCNTMSAAEQYSTELFNTVGTYRGLIIKGMKFVGMKFSVLSGRFNQCWGVF